MIIIIVFFFQWSILSTIPLAAFVTLIVQGIYTHRLVKLNGDPVWMKWVFGGLIGSAFASGVS